MKHHTASIKGGGGTVGGRGGGGGGGNGGSKCVNEEIIRGRTPIIFHSESGSSDSSSSPLGYSTSMDNPSQQYQRQRAPFRRPPPYRTVPLPWPAGSAGGPAGSQAARPVRASSVPPQSVESDGQTVKPVRPKSLHQDFHAVTSLQLPRSDFLNHHRLQDNHQGASVADQSGHHNSLQRQPPKPAPSVVTHSVSNSTASAAPRCYPLRPSMSVSSALPLSVSLQFDSLTPEWSTSELPVPSPAPAERRHFVRPSRSISQTDNKLVSSDGPMSRSSSVPRDTVRSEDSGGRHFGRQPRPLSHPSGPNVGSSQWAFSSQPAHALRSHESLLSGRHPLSGTTPCLMTTRSHGHLDHPATSLNQRHHHHQEDHAESLTCSPHTGIAPLRWLPNCYSSFQLGATPAPAPSPSSTPSPSSRPLAHLPTDALRTNNGIRILKNKLDLYVDIIQVQERFVQVHVES